MVTVSKRTRSRRVEDEVDDEDDEAEEEAPRRTRTAAKKTVTRRRDTAAARKAAGGGATKTRPRQVVEDDDDEDEDDVDWEDDDENEDDEDEEDETPRKSTARRSTSKRSSSRRVLDEDDDEDEGDDDDEDDVEPRRRSSSRRGGKQPTGVRTGWAGAEQTLKSGGGGVDRLALSNEPSLVKFLEDGPFASGRQHWVNTGDSQSPNRPYICIGSRDCPLCKLNDPAVAFYGFNVLHLSEGDEEPQVRVLQIGTKALEALKSAATNRAGKVVINKDFWTVIKSGKNQRAQTNFRPVKIRDLEEDWPEIFESFDVEELDDIIASAKKKLYKPEIFKPSTLRQLKEIARYLADEED